MKPAGLSSDEEDEFDDDYFCFTSPVIPISRKKTSKTLPETTDDDMRTLIDNCNNVSLFRRAAIESNFELMRELINRGVSVNESNVNEWTPLIEACSKGNHEVVAFLLENGADPNLHKELFTPLMACCINNSTSEEDRVACLRLLIQYGADVNATDKYMSTVLMTATANGLERLVDELLNAPGIDINKSDSEGWNALFHAVNQNHKSLVQKLVNAGIDLNAMNKYKEYTAVELAELKDHSDLFQMLNTNECEEEREIFQTKDFLQEFLNEFPDSKGQGGFANEVRNIFLGLGLEKLYDKLKINIPFPDFLVLSDLTKIGVKLAPVKQNILTNGIHKYHKCPWKKSSLHPILSDKLLDFEDCINMLSNVTKHLTILYATLDYIRIRVSKKMRRDKYIDQDMIRVLVDSYVEIQKTKKTFKNILLTLQQVKSVGAVQADYVGPAPCNGRVRLPKYIWVAAGTITIATAYFYYKFR